MYKHTIFLFYDNVIRRIASIFQAFYNEHVKKLWIGGFFAAEYPLICQEK